MSRNSRSIFYSNAVKAVVFFLILVFGCILLFSASREIFGRLISASNVLEIPEGIPYPNIPEGKNLNKAKVELGRYLFYDTRLSINETMSCGSCHIQSLAFTDGKPRAIGVTGEVHPRNTMSLANIAYAPRLTWANPVLNSLEAQALIPIFGDSPIEMGMAANEGIILDRLNQDEQMVAMLAQAFNDSPSVFSMRFVVDAIASFQRTLISFNSPYDRFNRGDLSALSPSQLRGMELFMSERLECFHCHGGPTFTDSIRHDRQIEDTFAFHNTALYSHKRLSETRHPGIAEITLKEEDVGRFKAPTLRNIAVTAPYMHDGSIATLEAVISHYEHGGRAGDGHPNKSEFIRGFILKDSEREDLLSFFNALTDKQFLTNPKFSDPNS